MCFRPPTVGKPKKCEKCGTMNPPAAKECRKCKNALSNQQEPIECARCGQMNAPDAPACTNCGLTAAEVRAAKPVKCPTCGFENLSVAVQCKKCNAPL